MPANGRRDLIRRLKFKQSKQRDVLGDVGVYPIKTAVDVIGAKVKLKFLYLCSLNVPSQFIEMAVVSCYMLGNTVYIPAIIEP